MAQFRTARGAEQTGPALSPTSWISQPKIAGCKFMGVTLAESSPRGV
jgi:hypothetical protein